MPDCVIAIDPGDRHIGFASWRPRSGVQAKEVDASDFLKLLDGTMRNSKVDVVVVESFIIYPKNANALSWQRLRTSEMIGAIRWISESNGATIVEQAAAIKTPTRAQCTARRLEWKHRSGHASDAKLHLYHYLLKNGLIT